MHKAIGDCGIAAVGAAQFSHASSRWKGPNVSPYSNLLVTERAAYEAWSDVLIRVFSVDQDFYGYPFDRCSSIGCVRP